jgi:hypothetical protein
VRTGRCSAIKLPTVRLFEQCAPKLSFLEKDFLRQLSDCTAPTNAASQINVAHACKTGEIFAQRWRPLDNPFPPQKLLPPHFIRLNQRQNNSSRASTKNIIYFVLRKLSSIRPCEMPIVVIRATYMEQNALEIFLTGLFGPGQSQVTVRRPTQSDCSGDH